MVSLRLSILLTLLFVMFAAAVPEPHRGMIDNDDIRDVGVVYTAANFTGTRKFIFETKRELKCLPLYVTPLDSQYYQQSNEEQLRVSRFH